MTAKGQSRTWRAPARRIRNAGYYVAGRLWRDAIVGIRTDQKVVALTFDDGPDPDYAPGILDALREHKVPATFFLLGRNVDAHPQSARQIAEHGHTLGNHGYSHRRFPDLSRAELAREIFDCEDAIERATGQRPRLVRPPYGNQTAAKHALLRSLGYQTTFWSASGDDWRGDPSQDIASRAIDQTRPGGIILLHDGWEPAANDISPKPTHDRLRDRTPTIQALPIIVDTLTRQGYRFVTVPDLLKLGRPRRQRWFVPD